MRAKLRTPPVFKVILSLMTEKPEDVAKLFWDHLEKDIEYLAETLSRDT